MHHRIKLALSVTAATLLATAAIAQPEHEGGRPEGGRPEAGRPEGGRPAGQMAEPHAGPRGYQRPSEPQGWNQRPATVDRGAYQHNYQAARSYRIGPYHAPRGYEARHWAYGQILPRDYWASQYIIGDYWLFGLEVPPGGYEWVRVGDDAVLVNVDSGEILQVEYGAFA
jgi:Ni/Co efflux regulator RcnB